MILLFILYWIIVQIGIAWWSSKWNISFLNHFDWLIASSPFELHHKHLYEKYLSIHKWKSRIPDAGCLFIKGTKKKSLVSTKKDKLNQLKIEIDRAELSHWFQILPCLPFFFFTDFTIALIMCFYAFGANIPFILVQRYNRLKLLRILDSKTRMQKKKACLHKQAF
ncbi:hypothetical protein [Bacillus coahuilensis]|uniref:glycosyl-4,4'-diaponeurosporenoate acyltransferase CrtO family protein n=1 Tax=Bacillus coahuilensis TaxID=408580 RepID=UPI0007504141|nr:hypothetical protein [Bacillus coahuilensis]